MFGMYYVIKRTIEKQVVWFVLIQELISRTNHHIAFQTSSLANQHQASIIVDKNR